MKGSLFEQIDSICDLIAREEAKVSLMNTRTAKSRVDFRSVRRKVRGMRSQPGRLHKLAKAHKNDVLTRRILSLPAHSQYRKLSVALVENSRTLLDA